MVVSSLTTLHTLCQTLNFSTISKEQPLFKLVTRLFQPILTVTFHNEMSQSIWAGTHAVYTKFWKYIQILWPMCFLVDLVQKKKIIINIHFFAIFLSKGKIKMIKKITPKPQICWKKLFKGTEALYITFDISWTIIGRRSRKITFTWHFRLKCCPLKNITVFKPICICFFLHISKLNGEVVMTF